MTDKELNIKLQDELARIIEDRDKRIRSIDAEINPIVDRMNASTSTREDTNRYNELTITRKAAIKTAKDAYNTAFNKAITPITGLKVGDRVHWTRQTIFLSIDSITGTVVKYRGQIQVKLDTKISGKRYTDIHTGWHILKEAI